MRCSAVEINSIHPLNHHLQMPTGDRARAECDRDEQAEQDGGWKGQPADEEVTFDEGVHDL